jgi:conflict system pore-forming effector with SLATT domain
MSMDLVGTKMTLPVGGEDGFLPAIFAFVEERADAAIGWYWAAKAWPARLSKGLRFTALLLFGIGALPPFLDAIGVLPKSGVSWTSIGYLALALGGGALAFDHFFGLSSGYTRYVTTAMSLERTRNEFRMDWLTLMSKNAPITPATNVEPFVNRASAFLKVVLDLVDRETQAWVAEFRANLSELEKIGKAPQEAQPPGAPQPAPQPGAAPPAPGQPGVRAVAATSAIRANAKADATVEGAGKAQPGNAAGAPVAEPAPKPQPEGKTFEAREN